MRNLMLVFLVALITPGAGCRPGGEGTPRDPGDSKPAVAMNDAAPLDVVREYARAWRDGDGDKFLSLVHVANDEQRKSALAFADLITNTAKLRAAASQKFGAPAAEQLLELTPLPTTDATGRQMLEHLDSPGWDEDVEIAGDRATVGVEPIGVVKLQKVARQWKVVLGDPDADADDESDNAMMYRKLADIHREFATHITAGKYTTADQALQAYRNRMSAPD